MSTLNLPTDPVEAQAVWDACHTRSARRLVQAALDNGGMYVKLGQTFGAMNQLLPRVYLQELSVLQDRARTQGYEEIKQTFVKEFGRPPEEIFKEFEEKPLGAASLAQVKDKMILFNFQPTKYPVPFLSLMSRFTGLSLRMARRSLSKCSLLISQIALTRISRRSRYCWISSHGFTHRLRLGGCCTT